MRFRNLQPLLATIVVILSIDGVGEVIAQETVRVFQSKNVPVSELVPQVEQELRGNRLSVELSCNPAQNTLKMQGRRTDVDSALTIVRQLDRPSTAAGVTSSTTGVVPVSASIPSSRLPRATAVRPVALEMVVSEEKVGEVAGVSLPAPPASAGGLTPSTGTAGFQDPAVVRSQTSVESQKPSESVVTSTIALKRIHGDSLTDRLMVIFGERFVSLDLNLYGLQTVARQDGIQIAVDTEHQTVTAVGPVRLVSQFRSLVSVLENSNEGSVDQRTLIVRTGGDASDLTTLREDGWISGRIRVMRVVNAAQSRLREAINIYRSASVSSQGVGDGNGGNRSDGTSPEHPTVSSRAIPVSAMTSSECLRRAHEYAAQTRRSGSVRPVSYEATVDDFGAPITAPADSGAGPGVESGPVDEATIPANDPPASPATLVPLTAGG
ncbi:MAG: hypothetical protein Q4C47_02355, partial [Planctomycetia bacterium]|nr:hypothetical protein [Planctomycetia bacterium]